ncbi:hypothetical protein [Neisseria polysaccharea]|uniref:hypothetical protein n=1 Tax=Neisseria polysaccharea TaxID=489 RepID=UPI0018C3A1CB
MPSERRQMVAGRSFGAFRQISRGIVVEKNGAGQVGTRYADGDIYSYSGLNLNQYSVASPCRTICTVCGFVALS